MPQRLKATEHFVGVTSSPGKEDREERLSSHEKRGTSVLYRTRYKSEYESHDVLRTSYPVKANQSTHSAGPYARCAAAAGLSTQHPSNTQMCVVVDARDTDGICRQPVVTVAFLVDETLECLLR